MDEALGMIVYSALLSLALAAASPWWGWRMLRSGRYRTGLRERLGRVPDEVLAAVAGSNVVWVHAVSVGEVLAVARLIAELQQRLGEGWVIAVSTTTATGQKIAEERLAPLGCTVFFFPLDFRFAVRRWMQVLRPRMLLLVESELWPRLLHECKQAGVPVAVVNARLSDRSFRRARRVGPLWRSMARKVSLWLAQSEETATRLRQLGVDHVEVSGNLKYDLAEVPGNAVAAWIGEIAAGRPVIVAGSTLGRSGADGLSEEELIVQAWEGSLRSKRKALLVLAPRHPERFAEVWAMATEFVSLSASDAKSTIANHANAKMRSDSGVNDGIPQEGKLPVSAGYAEIVLLDTLGDLASVYALATVAFIGGSLVPAGGHNPLEAARFGVPVLMGPSYENFREIVDGMRAADAIRIVPPQEVAAALLDALEHGQLMGERGRLFYKSQAGATARTVAALLALLDRSPA